MILDNQFYKEKMMEILNDKNTYKELDKNIDSSIMNKIKKLTKEHETELTKKEIKYLTDFKYQSSQLYGLPKIHKSDTINKKIKESPSEFIEVEQPCDLQMRPIVAGPNCVTSRLSSSFLDVLLKPLLKHVKSYVRDDTDFLDKVPKTTADSKILLTLDIRNMYPNIDNDLGQEATEFCSKSFEDSTGINTFTFNNRTYLQIKGCSMGSKVSPTYVTLVMAYWELKLYKIIEEKYGEEFKDQFIKDWLRFLDDCFINWDENIDTTENLLKIIQNLHPSIKFTLKESKKEIDYLDVKVQHSHHRPVPKTYGQSTVRTLQFFSPSSY